MHRLSPADGSRDSKPSSQLLLSAFKKKIAPLLATDEFRLNLLTLIYFCNEKSNFSIRYLSYRLGAEVHGGFKSAFCCLHE
jgi:hypothetical protein